MPELPEVEVTRRRLAPQVVGRTIVDATVRVAKLRFPLEPDLADRLRGEKIQDVERRGKYLLFRCRGGTLIIHLGMTGFLRLHDSGVTAGKYDHVDFLLDDGRIVRFHDPRKFGTIIWTVGDPLCHPLLAGIGPEPLSQGFDGDYLFATGRKRRTAVKQFIMDAAVVAGVGNIYANEALFRAGIAPARPAGDLTREDCARLADAIRDVLDESVQQGSTYQVAEETVSYHPLTFNVYGRGGQPCRRCGSSLVESRLGNRSSVSCLRCQS